MIAAGERVATKTAKPKGKQPRRRPEDDLALGRDKAGVVVSHRGKDRGPTDAEGRPIAEKHGEFIVEGDTEKHLKRANPSPLDRYKARNELSDDSKENFRLWLAGDRLRTDFAAMRIDQRVTADLTAVGGGGKQDMPPKQVAAYERVKRAMRALHPPLDVVTTFVVWREGSAADWARSHGWQPAHGMGALKAALEILASHYGMK